VKEETIRALSADGAALSSTLLCLLVSVSEPPELLGGISRETTRLLHGGGLSSGSNLRWSMLLLRSGSKELEERSIR
jgi:hypothetical protein